MTIYYRIAMWIYCIHAAILARMIGGSFWDSMLFCVLLGIAYEIGKAEAKPC